MKRDAQAAMVRIAAADGRVQPDGAGRRPGRGGYLHRSPACLTRFERSRVQKFRSLQRSLSAGERRDITESIRSRLATSADLE